MNVRQNLDSGDGVVTSWPKGFFGDNWFDVSNLWRDLDDKGPERRQSDGDSMGYESTPVLQVGETAVYFSHLVSMESDRS